MSELRNEIICGDCVEVIRHLPHAKMVFADPPDNRGLKYRGYDDRLSDDEYTQQLVKWLVSARVSAEVVWLSIDLRWMDTICGQIQHWKQGGAMARWDWKWLIWRYTFGQHNHYDCASGFRPILRMRRREAPLYPDAIRVQSQRQRNGDKRADPRGRVPDDVWEFPRVCGNFKERRAWHPTQHPEALIERMVRFSCTPGDLVIDMFAGTGTVNRVCRRLGIACIGIELSEEYCEHIRRDMAVNPR